MRDINSTSTTIRMIRAEKSILCPISGSYHPVDKCAECSYLRNRVDQVLYDGQTLEYVLCSYDHDGHKNKNEGSVR